MRYQVERWSDCCREMEPLFRLHYEEIAHDRDLIPLDVNWSQYKALEDAGILHVVTARADRLVGYHVLMVCPHLHYASTVMAHSDIFWLHPAHRKGWAGINLFRFTEKTLKARGVTKVFLPTKPHMDVSKVFHRLGYALHETTYAKVI